MDVQRVVHRYTVHCDTCILNQFFEFHTEPLLITSLRVQVAALTVGHLMAAWLAEKRFRVPLTAWTFTLNPGRFNMKEHVLITMFAGAGAYVAGGQSATAMIGSGWAGMLRKYLVEPTHMWLPSNLPQVHVFQTRPSSYLEGALLYGTEVTR
ncbi:hypothetical protein Mapa_011333 [Marchantia paleacea]|nr:hypothetical protein Mapa_011333 [Marchantia paleacea]